MKSLVAIGCLIALPLMAQTTTTTTMEAKTTTTSAKSTKKTTPKKIANRAKVENDATRLAAILSDAQNDRMNFSADAWKVTVNEANSLANRVYANTGGKAQARDLRMHVRMMREAAMKGDAAGARQHASEALPFAYQIIDWVQS